jgi:hypothetical protein
MGEQVPSRRAPLEPSADLGRRLERANRMARFPTARELTILCMAVIVSASVFWTAVFYVNDAIMRQRDEQWRDYSATRTNAPAASKELRGEYPFGGTNPQSNLDALQFRVMFAFFLLATAVQGGLGLELLIWVMFLRHGWPKVFDKAWVFSQFAFPMLTISSVGAAINHDFMAMIFIVLGLWRFGLPYTFLYFQSAIFNAQKHTVFHRFADLLTGSSLVLHHTAVCFFVSLLLAGVWERTPYVATTFPILMVQYILTVVRDGSDGIIIILLFLISEFLFEWTVFSTFQVNAMTHWSIVQVYNCIVVSHWLYGASQVMEMLRRRHTEENNPNSDLQAMARRFSQIHFDTELDEKSSERVVLEEETIEQDERPIASSYPLTDAIVDPHSLGGRVESAKKGLSFPSPKQLWILFGTALGCVTVVLGSCFFVIDKVMSSRDPDWRDYSDVLIPPGYDPPSPEHLKAYMAALQTEAKYHPFAGSTPLLSFNIQQFQGLLAAVVMGVTVISGFGLELLVWIIFLKDGWSQDFEKMWKFSNFVFPLLVTVAIGMSTQRDFSYGFILVFGLWKGGMPETFMYLYSALYNHSKRDTVGRIADLLNGCGTAVHHTSVALFSAAFATGLVPVPPESIHCAVGPLMQHWFAFLHDVNFTAYMVTALSIEIWWEWVIFSTFHYVATVHWSFALTASSMLVAHWLYLAAGAVEIFSKMTLQKVGLNPVTRQEVVSAEMPVVKDKDGEYIDVVPEESEESIAEEGDVHLPPLQNIGDSEHGRVEALS